MSLSLSTVLQMQGAEQPFRAPLTLFAFDSPEAIKDYALGCDADVGGTSTVHLDFDDDPNPPASAPARKRGAARFHGHMRLAVRPGHEQRIRGGYAGFRNKVSLCGTVLSCAPRRSVVVRVRAHVHNRAFSRWIKTLVLLLVPPDAVRGAHGRRVESPIPRVARAGRGTSAHARFLLCQRPDGGPDERRPVAASAVLFAGRRWVGRRLCAFIFTFFFLLRLARFFVFVG